MLEGQNNKFLSNALVYVKRRTLTAEAGLANWALLGNFVSPKNYYLITDIEVSNNVGMGSEDTGFSFMTVPCNQVDKNAFINNQVSSVILAGLIYRQTAGDCSLIKTGGAFHAKRGIMGTINTNELRVENVVLAENDVSLIMRVGTDNDYSNAWLQKNWYITGIARPTCTKCYDSEFGNVCSNQVGYLMAAVSSAAFPPPIVKPTDNIDVICTIQRIDTRTYIDSATFANFKVAYDQLPNCKNNKAIRTHHGAVD
jgi:nitrous oxidase accessory protein NosD